jgi:hypothetical protein
LATSTTSGGGRRSSLLLAACLLAGLALRGAAITAAPDHAYLMDHVMFMTWSDWAYEHGPTRVYEQPAGHLVWVRKPPDASGTRPVEAIALPMRCNYPPLATAIFWLQGWLWHRLDHEVVTGYALRRTAAGGTETVPVASRVVNTTTSRFVNALAGIVADLLLAVGVTRLVRAVAGRPAPAVEVLAFALALLAPPMVLDSAFWSQSDGWIACVLVWCMVSLVRGRFVAAGILYGAGLMLKAQAVLLAPVLLFVGVALTRGEHGSLAHAWRAGRAFALGALAAAALVALPFTIDRDAGPGSSFAWLERAYVEPMLEQYPYTTTMAFNLWWLEGAAADTPGKLRDARAEVAGMSKDTIGRLLLAAGIVAGIALSIRRFGWGPTAWVAAAFLVTFAAFVLPTRVKARYVYYCLPFAIVMAAHFRPWVPALVGLMVVATFELTWNLWFTAAAAGARQLSVGLAALSVLSFGYALAALVATRAASARASDHST